MCLCGFREGAPHYHLFKENQLFQIESGLGIIASICEMFFQDGRGLLRLLPALPEALPSGEISGLRGRSGFEVDLRWDKNRLVEARIVSLRGEQCRIKSFRPAGKLSVKSGGAPVATTYKDGITEFASQQGVTYVVVPK